MHLAASCLLLINLQSLTCTIYMQKYAWYTCKVLHISTTVKNTRRQLTTTINENMQHCSIQLQKEVKSIPSCKKMCAAHKKAIVKNMWNPRWRPRLAVMVTTIQVNLVPNCSKTWRGNTNSAQLLLLKFLAISLPSQPFVAATLDFTCFHNGLLGATHFFYSWAVFGLD